MGDLLHKQLCFDCAFGQTINAHALELELKQELWLAKLLVQLLAQLLVQCWLLQLLVD